jgi:hypothetical protein
MFEKIAQLRDVTTGKSYKEAPEEVRGACSGCAFYDKSDLCREAPDYCGVQQIIWKEVEQP